MVAVFYAANTYDRGLSGLLYYVKWLTVLPVIAVSWSAGHRGSMASGRVALSVLPLVLICFAALLSVLAAPNIGESAMIFASLLLAFVASYSLVHAIADAGGERQFFNAVALVGRLVIVSAAAMWLVGLNLGRGGEGRFSAWTDNPNTLALLLAPTLVILMADVLARRRGWLWWSLPFLAAGGFLLIMTGSRASILWGLAAGLGFYSFRRGIGLSLVLNLVVFIVAVEFWDEIVSFVLGLVQRDSALVTADVLSGRSEVWTLGLELIDQAPLLGHGIGMSQSLLAQYEGIFIEHQGGHFHSSYLTIAVETGLAGFSAVLLVLLLALAAGAQRSSRVRRQRLADWPLQALPWAMVVGALAHAVFETWLLSAGNANMILMWTCILLLLARARSPAATVSTYRLAAHNSQGQKEL